MDNRESLEAYANTPWQRFKGYLQKLTCHNLPRPEAPGPELTPAKEYMTNFRKDQEELPTLEDLKRMIEEDKKRSAEMYEFKCNLDREDRERRRYYNQLHDELFVSTFPMLRRQRDMGLERRLRDARRIGRGFAAVDYLRDRYGDPDQYSDSEIEDILYDEGR